METTNQSEIEKVMKKVYYEFDTAVSYKIWVKNFALNLENIWKEKSAKKLVVNTVSDNAIVIGRGPSLKNHDHLNKLKNSNYNGAIICTDGALITALKAGITPDRFPEFYVVTVDPRTETIKFYNDKIISEYNGKIKGVFSTVSNPDTVKKARESGIEIFWFHSLVDYNEGEKSFNQISALMTRAKNHENGLPAIQTGGNVGTSSWFLGWKILNCKTITLIGINHGWEDTDSWDTIMTHNGMCKMIEMDKNSESFKKLFPRVYNPDFDCYCILDPIFQYYSAGLKEFIFRSPQDIKTINSTEGGCIFGDRIESMKLDEFLIKFD
ncbi:DUF115 domain-containing protein [Nitrosopumilus sp.]|nr:DUF115 domain-containing protein [Nitrosopumilus sp.]